MFFFFLCRAAPGQRCCKIYINVWCNGPRCRHVKQSVWIKQNADQCRERMKMMPQRKLRGEWNHHEPPLALILANTPCFVWHFRWDPWLIEDWIRLRSRILEEELYWLGSVQAAWPGLLWWGSANLIKANTWWDFPGGSVEKNLPANAGDEGWIPGQKDPLEKEMATLSGILAWRIPGTEEPDFWFSFQWTTWYPGKASKLHNFKSWWEGGIYRDHSANSAPTSVVKRSSPNPSNKALPA